MNGAASGTSRRAFLGRAAGAAAVVAGAGAGVGAITQSAAAADQRTYTAGRFALDIDGVSCGALAGVDGGDLDGDVILDAVGEDYIQRKHIAGVKYEDFTLQVGSGMAKPMYQWIKNSFDGKIERRSASIRSGDSSWNERSNRHASQAYISSVTIPALDGASKETGYLAVDLSCDKVATLQPSGQPIQAAKQKAWLCSNFVVEIDGVDTSRVATIDSFTWKCDVDADGVAFVLSVSDIGVTFPRSSLASWQHWYDGLIAGSNDERQGALTLLGAGHGGVCTFSLSNLGLYRLSSVPGAAGRVKAEMYVEQLGYSFDVEQTL